MKRRSVDGGKGHSTERRVPVKGAGGPYLVLELLLLAAGFMVETAHSS